MARAAHSKRSTAGNGVAARQSPYLVLKESILRSDFAPGQPLVETALASQLSVSRTPVREALNRLEQDGLVERSERGLVVRQRSTEEILDIYEARIALEGTVGRSAASRRTEYDLRALHFALEEAGEVADEDDDARMETNRQFHRTMWRASHNEALVDLLERLDLHMVRYPATTLSYPGRWRQAMNDNRMLLQAVEDRDGERAWQIATAHFTEARDIRLKLWHSAVI